MVWTDFAYWGGRCKYFRIYHNDRPTSLIGGGYLGSFVSITMIDRLRLGGGFQGMFASITMIDRRRLLGGWLSRYIRIYHTPISLIGGLWQEIFVSITLAGGLLQVFSYLSQ